jgi:hypothetical protein
MMHRKTWVIWVLTLVGLGSIFYIIGSNKREIHVPPTPAAAPGLNFPTQAGFATIYNGFVPNVMHRMTNGLDSRKSYAELESRFLYGYVIMGIQNGQVIYDLHLKDFQISADWDDAILSFSTEGNWGYVYIPRLKIMNPKNNSEFEQVDTGQYFPLQYPEPFRWNLSNLPGIPCAFLEVLDQDKKLLLVGFNSCK